jgi:hypothetical protein
MSDVNVELRAFSGNPNPTFVLDDSQLATLAACVADTLSGGSPAEEEQPAGQEYAGFVVSEGADEGLPDLLIVVSGLVTAVTDAGAVSYSDAGCEDALIAIARDNGLGDLLDTLGVSGGSA